MEKLKISDRRISAEQKGDSYPSSDVAKYQINTSYSNKHCSQVLVEFEMPYHGWMQLKESHEWKELLKCLEVCQKQGNMKSHMKGLGLSEI